MRSPVHRRNGKFARPAGWFLLEGHVSALLRLAQITVEFDRNQTRLGERLTKGRNHGPNAWKRTVGARGETLPQRYVNAV